MEANPAFKEAKISYYFEDTTTMLIAINEIRVFREYFYRTNCKIS